MADEDEPDAQFSVAVEDFGGAWAHVAQARHAHATPELIDAALCAPSVHRCDAHGRALAAQALAVRLPLKNITLPNKFGNPVPLDSLHIRCAARAVMHPARSAAPPNSGRVMRPPPAGSCSPATRATPSCGRSWRAP